MTQHDGRAVCLTPTPIVILVRCWIVLTYLLTYRSVLSQSPASPLQLRNSPHLASDTFKLTACRSVQPVCGLFHCSSWSTPSLDMQIGAPIKPDTYWRDLRVIAVQLISRWKAAALTYRSTERGSFAIKNDWLIAPATAVPTPGAPLCDRVGVTGTRNHCR